jgi:hypothetical protein
MAKKIKENTSGGKPKKYGHKIGKIKIGVGDRSDKDKIGDNKIENNKDKGFQMNQTKRNFGDMSFYHLRIITITD